MEASLKGLEEGDTNEVYHMAAALQIYHLNMKDILVRVWVTHTRC